MNFSPFVRQMFVAIATQLVEISMGGALGYPCVLLQQYETDFDTLTWIASMHGISGIGATLMPTVMQQIGRKYTFILSSVLLLIGWILAFVSKDVFTVILSAIAHGLSSNCITIINLVTISEMLAPKYRFTLMVLLNFNQSLGLLLVTVLGTVLNWQTVAMVMSGPIFVALLLVIVWLESPSWLAYKGKYEESEKAFVLLRGTDEEATKELKAMMAAQKETKNIISKKTMIRETWQKMKRRDFYQPSLYMLLILITFYLSGVQPMFIYSKDILETVIGDSKIVVIGYVATVCTLFTGSLISFVLIKYFKTKTVLSTSLGCIACLFGCSLVPYLQSIGLIVKDSYLFLYFFLGFMFFSNCGFNPISYALSIDLMPVKNRGMGGALFNILNCLFFSVAVKAFPYVMQCVNVWWLFFLLGVFCSLGTVLIWIYIPETKNRTLQEIEDYYNYGSFDRRRDIEDNEVTVPIARERKESVL